MGALCRSKQLCPTATAPRRLSKTVMGSSSNPTPRMHRSIVCPRRLSPSHYNNVGSVGHRSQDRQAVAGGVGCTVLENLKAMESVDHKLADTVKVNVFSRTSLTLRP